MYWKRKKNDPATVSKGFSFKKMFENKTKGDINLAAKGSNKQFRGKCNLCGRQGHKKENCWELEENASKRPKNWKSCLPTDEEDDDKANAANSTQNQKCVLCGKSDHMLHPKQQRKCKGEYLHSG